jgi:calcineurin-like phosphoesterase family protein
MANIFFLSDPHLVENFKRADGTPLRDFVSVEEHDETFVQRWNDTVQPQDHAYCLGDVTMLRGSASTMAPVEALLRRLHGHKRLVLGNHDQQPAQWYLKFFEKIFAIRVIDNMCFTHMPIERTSMGRFAANVHGHVHASAPFVYLIDGYRYVNVSAEAIDYRPVSLDAIKKAIAGPSVQ